MMETISQALIVRPTTPPTTFGEFLASLQERRPAASVQTMAGSAQWGQVPVVTMVAEGLWPVLQRAAEKLNLRLETDRMIGEVSHRVDRVLRAGLLLRYVTPEGAALAFWQDVADASLEEAAARRVRLQAMAPAAVWQIRAAKFFAGLLRTANEVREQAERLLVRAMRDRSIHALLPELSVLDGERMDRLTGLVRSLRLESEIAANYVPTPHQIHELLHEAKQLADDDALIRSLPIRHDGLMDIDTSVMPFPSVQVHWIRTQVLLAAARAATATEQLTMGSFVTGMRVVRSMDVEVSAERFVRRMEKRGAAFTTTQRERLHALAAEQVRKIQSREWEGNVTINDACDVFLSISLDKINLDALEAFDLASDPSSKMHPFIQMGLVSFGRERLQEKISADVAWEALTVEQIGQIFKAQVLEESALFLGLARVPLERRIQSLEQYFRTLRDGDEAVYSRREFAEMIFESVERVLEISPQRLIDGLPTIFFVAKHQPMSRERFKNLVAALAGLPRTALRRTLRDPKLRTLQAEFLMENLFNSFTDQEYRIGAEERTLAEVYGKDLWRRFVLCEEISYRDGLYAGASSKEECESMFPRWEHRGELIRLVNTTWEGLRLRIDLPARELKELLSRLTEERVLRWVAEGMDNPKAFIATYLANRETYYASWNASRAPRRASKRSTKRG